MQLTIHAWKAEDNNSFDCEYNEKLHRYFISAKAISSLILVDPKARWNQELENVFLIQCENRNDYHIMNMIYVLIVCKSMAQ